MRTITILTAGLLVMFMSAVPVIASGQGGQGGNPGNQSSGGSDVIVINDNYASVFNMVKVEANTGDNDADGGDGEEGGEGGDAEENDNAGGTQINTGGDGGNGGDGGLGGIIITGDALAMASITTKANYNRTLVDLCACEEDNNDSPCGCHTFGRQGGCNNDSDEEEGDEGDVKVENKNVAEVNNGLEVEAETGDNDADGGDGEEGGEGGDAEENTNGGDGTDGVVCQGPHCGHNNNQSTPANQTNTGGDGGDGGDGAEGGQILSGFATSLAEILTVLNVNITRILR
jgi:hypothetical protein